MKKAMVAAVAAVAMMAAVPGVANASDTGYVPSYDGSYTPSYEGNVPEHAPSMGYVDGARTADVDLGGGIKVAVVGHGGDLQAPKTTSKQAKGTDLKDGWVAPASKSLIVEPTYSNAKTKGATSATLYINLGDKYEGAQVKVFAEHGPEWFINQNPEYTKTDVYEGTTNGKLATVEVPEFSTFTIAVKGGKGGTNGVNTSSKSPVTGVNFADIADYVADLF